jgi:hypothetical protein
LTRIEGKIDTNHNTVQGQLNAINAKLDISKLQITSVASEVLDTGAGSSNGNNPSKVLHVAGGGYKKSRTHKRLSKLTPRRR